MTPDPVACRLQHRVKEALPVILEAMSLPDDLPEKLFGDAVYHVARVLPCEAGRVRVGTRQGARTVPRRSRGLPLVLIDEPAVLASPVF